MIDTLINYSRRKNDIEIHKGADKVERKQKQHDADISRTMSVQDYNIMMGNLEDPNEEEEED